MIFKLPLSALATRSPNSSAKKRMNADASSNFKRFDSFSNCCESYNIRKIIIIIIYNIYKLNNIVLLSFISINIMRPFLAVILLYEYLLLGSRS